MKKNLDLFELFIAPINHQNSIDGLTFGEEVNTILESNGILKHNSSDIFLQIARKYLGDNISEEKIDFFRLGQSTKDFEDFIKYDRNRIIFENMTLEICELFLGINGFLKTTYHYISFFLGIKENDIESFFSSENLKIIFGDNGVVLSGDFLDLMNDPESPDKLRIIDLIINIILKGNCEHVKNIFGKDKIIKSISDIQFIVTHVQKNENIIKIINGKNKSLSFIIGENKPIHNIESLVDFLNSPLFDLFLEKISSKVVYHLINTFGVLSFEAGISIRKYLEKIASSGILSYEKAYFDHSSDLLGQAYNQGFNYDILGEQVLSFCFPERIDSKHSSKILIQLYKKLKKSPSLDIHDLMRKEVKLFLANNKLTQQEAGDKEIAVYLRYGKNNVDYPEIGELIIIFLQESIRLNLIKGVKSIKILPRNIGYFPRSTILTPNSRYVNCDGADFLDELQKSEILFYTSHSTNESLDHQITVTSNGTDGGNKNISLNLELEEEYDKNFFFKKTKNKSINQVLSNMMKVISEINKY